MLLRHGLLSLASLALAAGCATTATSLSGGADLADPKVGAIELVDMQGAPRTLGEFRGKVVLLDFWATWCGPCKESLPIYDKWQTEFGPKGLAIVAVSVDEEDAAVPAFVKDLAPNLLVLRDKSGKAAGAFDLPTMPTSFLFDRSGKLLSRHVGFERGSEETIRKATLDALAAP